MRSILAASLLLLAANPASADAITYSGTLGGTAIIVELTEPSHGPSVGRYSYLKVGGDIPLQAVEADDEVRLAEEAPCAEGTCPADDEGIVALPPIGAHWALHPLVGNETLTGIWTPTNGGKSLPIELRRVGQRPLPEGTDISPYGLRDSVATMTYGANSSLLANSPYEALEMQVTLKEGKEQTLQGSLFRYVTDPRTRFPFPRVVSLADGSDPTALNQALARRHGLMNYYAFDCLAQAYAGFGARDDMLGMGFGTLGDYDYENVELTYLSPTVAGWTEGGSTFCGGAYPNNHFDSYLLDVRTGEPLDLSRIFRGWVAKAYGDETVVDPDIARANPDDYYWGASKSLVEWVRVNRVPSTDAGYEEECGVDELIGTNLAIRFAPGDKVIFSLGGLPHVIFACTDDLMTIELAEIPELLTDEARDYFPSLN